LNLFQPPFDSRNHCSLILSKITFLAIFKSQFKNFQRTKPCLA
jgi:hypothetical protein